jgi:hypothetical protein
MDDETKQLLRQIRDLQLEQLELTRKIYSGIPPWLNWRFSVRHMFIGMAVVAIVLTVLILANQ